MRKTWVIALLLCCAAWSAAHAAVPSNRASQERARTIEKKRAYKARQHGGAEIRRADLAARLEAMRMAQIAAGFEQARSDRINSWRAAGGTVACSMHGRIPPWATVCPICGAR